GGTANNGVNTFSEQFTITVIPVNQTPTLAPISPNTITVPETTTPTPQNVGLSGISVGQNEPTQTIASIVATSSNPSLIPNPSITHTNPNPTGILTFTPTPLPTGTATTTTTATHSGGTANNAINFVKQTFTINVTPVNQPPTLSAITSPITVSENAATPVQ